MKYLHTNRDRLLISAVGSRVVSDLKFLLEKDVMSKCGSFIRQSIELGFTAQHELVLIIDYPLINDRLSNQCGIFA